MPTVTSFLLLHLSIHTYIHATYKTTKPHPTPNHPQNTIQKNEQNRVTRFNLPINLLHDRQRLRRHQRGPFYSLPQQRA
ncbi:hypothetical protein BKA80DRAFT_286777 [Phyllosticta citrichinensis]